MDVDNLPLIGPEKGFSYDAHIAGQAYQVHLPLIQEPDDLRLEIGFGGIIPGREDKGLHPHFQGPVDNGGARPVADHQDHPGVQDAFCTGLCNGNEVGARTAGKYC